MYCLSIDMPYDVFWHGDPWLIDVYHRAHQKKFEYDNTIAWLHGYYNYEANSVVQYNVNRNPKKGQRAEKYLSKPHRFTPLTESEKEEQEKNAWARIKSSLNTYKEHFKGAAK